MPEIRLNKKNQTIKVVNRRKNVRLIHAGKTGPEGPKGDAGGYFIPYVLHPVGDEAPLHEEFSVTAPQDLVFSRISQGNVDVSDFLTVLSDGGTLELFVKNDVTKWSVCAYTKETWQDNHAYAVGDLSNAGNNVYRAIQNHTSDTDSEPISGANWEDYWVLFAEYALAVSYNQLGTSYTFQGGEETGVAFNPEGPRGPQGETGESTFVRVHHGSDPDVPRPNATYVEWVGSVAPNNATTEDTWIHTP